MMQIGEAAVDQGTYEVHRQCRVRVRLNQTLRIRAARLRRERLTVDQVAAKAGQRHPIARLAIGRTRLGVLPGETTHAQHWLLQSMHQHQAHLQQHFETVGNDRTGAVAEAFRAVAALQQETMPLLCFCQRLLQRKYFP
jgi:hypothetical protein